MLTPKQQRILEFIKDFIRDEGMPPTRKELTEALGYRSQNSVELHLRELALRGYIQLVPKVSRGIRVLEND